MEIYRSAHGQDQRFLVINSARGGHTYRITVKQPSGSAESCTMSSMNFDRCNLHQMALDEVRAHGGEGLIKFARIAEAGALAGACNFIDYAELPPGASIGRHRHAEDEEELYLVLEGEGAMWRDGEQFAVRGGDLVRNRAGGEHGLRNTGASPLKLFVFELAVVP